MSATSHPLRPLQDPATPARQSAAADRRSGQIEIQVLRSIRDAAPYRDIWQRLSRHRDTDPSFFEFYLSTRPEAAPYILVLRDGTDTSLVIGRTEVTSLDGRIGYFRVPSPRLRVLELVHGGLLGNAETTLASEIIAHLRGVLRRGEVDAIRLHYGDISSPLFTAFLNLRGFLARCRPTPSVPHWVRQVRGTSTNSDSNISSKQRYAQRRREKRIVAEYSEQVTLVCYRDSASLPTLIRDAEYVASRSYQRGIQVGFKDTEPMRRRLKLHAEHGWLCAWILYLGDTPAALWIGALRNGTFFSDYMAFDNQMSHLAPGMYLIVKILEHARDPKSGISFVDFGPGHADYKAHFGTDVCMNANVEVFARTWRGICAGTIQSAAGLTTLLAKSTLERFGLREKVKRLLRRRQISPTNTEP